MRGAGHEGVCSVEQVTRVEERHSYSTCGINANKKREIIYNTRTVRKYIEKKYKRSGDRRRLFYNAAELPIRDFLGIHGFRRRPGSSTELRNIKKAYLYTRQ